MSYDRQLLLSGAKRNAVLELWEVQRYGMDSYGDADYVSVYGLPPADWYARGIRLLGRTAVECTRDVLGEAIAEDVAATAAGAPRVGETLVVDLFAGSGNTLYWLLRRIAGSRGLGFERDATVFELTRRNLAALALDIDILNCDHVSGLARVAAANDRLLVVFIAPPWGHALDTNSGLDLRRTEPPVADIVDLLLLRFPTSRLLFAIQIYEVVAPDPLAELQQRFDWSQVRSYALNAPGRNHGLLLGTGHWRP